MKAKTKFFKETLLVKGAHFLMFYSITSKMAKIRGQPDTFLDKLLSTWKNFLRGDLRLLSTLAFIDPLSHKNINGSDINMVVKELYKSVSTNKIANNVKNWWLVIAHTSTCSVLYYFFFFLQAFLGQVCSESLFFPWW